MKPNTPMLLPWLARKAGIGEHRAEVLWLAALRHAQNRFGSETGPTSEFWRCAMDRLFELIAAEKLRADAFGWRRLGRAGSLWYQWWQMPVAAFDGGSLLAQRAWRDLPEQQRRWQRALAR